MPNSTEVRPNFDRIARRCRADLNPSAKVQQNFGPLLPWITLSNCCYSLQTTESTLLNQQHQGLKLNNNVNIKSIKNCLPQFEMFLPVQQTQCQWNTSPHQPLTNQTHQASHPLTSSTILEELQLHHCLLPPETWFIQKHCSITNTKRQ